MGTSSDLLDHCASRRASRKVPARRTAADDSMSNMQDAYVLKDADGNPVEIKVNIPDGPVDAVVITLPDDVELFRISHDGKVFVRGEEVTQLPGPELGKAIAQAFFELQATREIPPKVWALLCSGCTHRVHQEMSAEALRRLGGAV